MRDVFIIGGLRTPIGGQGQALKDVSPIFLAATTIKALVKKTRIEGALIDEVIMGNVVSAGLGQNPARQSLIGTGLSLETPAFTVNKVCGSGLKAAILAIQAILTHSQDIVLAGGLESASQCPYIFSRKKKHNELEAEDVSDTLINDGLWCGLSDMHMGTIAEYTVEKFRISREEQDCYTLESHQKALLAQEKGLYQEEIAPVELNGKEILGIDEKPRKNMSIEKLSSLPSAFKPNGTVTAGNSSAPADGAAALIFSSKQGMEKSKTVPLARILGYATIAVESKLVFTAPALAIKKCLETSSLNISDVDIFEINEAFAVQALLTIRLAELDPKRMNIFGGTLALGHPLGVSGARGLVTLLNVLRSQKKKIGITSVCLGGGCAVAMAIEMVD